MTTALLTRGPEIERGDEWRPRRPPGEGPTLDDVVSRAWEVLRVDLPAACPVCGGELIPRASAGAGVVGGRCQSCGSALS
jgi:tRNA(Ile2) C34 agmatinyltransferase TiaS